MAEWRSLAAQLVPLRPVTLTAQTQGRRKETKTKSSHTIKLFAYTLPPCVLPFVACVWSVVGARRVDWTTVNSTAPQYHCALASLQLPTNRAEPNRTGGAHTKRDSYCTHQTGRRHTRRQAHHTLGNLGRKESLQRHTIPMQMATARTFTRNACSLFAYALSLLPCIHPLICYPGAAQPNPT